MKDEFGTELDRKLADAESGAWPLVRAATTTEPMREGFRAELAQRLRAARASGAERRKRRFALTWRWRGFSPALAGVAVALAAALVVAGGVVYPRLTSTSAAAVLDGIQTEALATSGGITLSTNGAAPSCRPPGGALRANGSAAGTAMGGQTVAIAVAGPVGDDGPHGPPAASAQVVSFGPGKSPPDGTGPTSINPDGLSDRLGQELGVSGDRVREAMRQALVATSPGQEPAKPADPFASIATQLGKSPQAVRDAFTNPACPADGPQIALNLPITADQVSGPAQRLGVSPDRLASALRAALPAPPPAPPSEDELIRRMAASLGVSEARLRAAIAKVEGPDQAYFFSFPLPSLGKP